MKKAFAFILLLLSGYATYAQDIAGDWSGVLKVDRSQLRLVVHLAKSESGYTGTMDSPDQGAAGIPLTTVRFEHNKLFFSFSKARIEYEGELKNGVITGTFTQGGTPFPLDLTSGPGPVKPAPVRPQEPKPPFPYRSEEVNFINAEAGITFGGTLTLPEGKGPFPAVVLISGSGQQDRDETLFGHKPFFVIADHLTRKGIAVLRYDERGKGKSGGRFGGATTVDFATDVKAAVNYLKNRREINRKQIGLIGHSEGGLIAPMLAADDPAIAFIAMLAGPGVTGGELLLFQQKHLNDMPDKGLEFNRGLYEVLAKNQDPMKLKAEIGQYVTELVKKDPGLPAESGATAEELVDHYHHEYSEPWIRFFITYDPVPTLEKVHCPVLALAGSKDLQVPASMNLPKIREALLKGGNTQVTAEEIPGLNHLFQECTTGDVSEYGTIEQTFSPLALDKLSSWLLAITR